MTDTNGSNGTTDIASSTAAGSPNIEPAPAARTRRWDPFAMLSELESEFDRMFGQRLPGFLPLRRYTGALGEGWAPSADVFEQNGDIVVKAELPGVNKEDIDVAVEKDALVIKGHRNTEEAVEEGDYYRMERFTGSFYRRFPLPDGVDEDRITADFTDGVLEVRVPKPSGDQEQPGVRKIAIS